MDYLFDTPRRTEANRLITSLARHGTKRLRTAATLADKIIGDNVIVSSAIDTDFDALQRWACPKADLFHFGILFPDADILNKPAGYYFRRGVMVIVNGEVMGYVKAKGERTFLALRTVVTPDERYPFLKYGIYTIDSHIAECLPMVERGTWGYTAAKSVHARPLRFLNPTPRYVAPVRNAHDFESRIEEELAAFEEKFRQRDLPTQNLRTTRELLYKEIQRRWTAGCVQMDIRITATDAPYRSHAYDGTIKTHDYIDLGNSHRAVVCNVRKLSRSEYVYTLKY